MSDAARSLHPALQEHFDDMEQQAEASVLGMWVFLATEVLFFGGLFLAYIVYRAWYPQAFAAGAQHMNVLLGTLNTVVLLGSSFAVALAVRAGRLGIQRAQVLGLVATLLLGVLFLVIKGVEYADHIRHGLVPGGTFRWDGAPDLAVHAELFFSLYFMMTGLHAVHMIIGIGLFTVLARAAWRGRFSSSYHTPLEVGGLYWHFIDIVWIFLFPLLYLIDQHGG